MPFGFYSFRSLCLSCIANSLVVSLPVVIQRIRHSPCPRGSSKKQQEILAKHTGHFPFSAAERDSCGGGLVSPQCTRGGSGLNSRDGDRFSITAAMMGLVPDAMCWPLKLRRANSLRRSLLCSGDACTAQMVPGSCICRPTVRIRSFPGGISGLSGVRMVGLSRASRAWRRVPRTMMRMGKMTARAVAGTRKGPSSGRRLGSTCICRGRRGLTLTLLAWISLLGLGCLPGLVCGKRALRFWGGCFGFSFHDTEIARVVSEKWIADVEVLCIPVLLPICNSCLGWLVSIGLYVRCTLLCLIEWLFEEQLFFPNLYCLCLLHYLYKRFCRLGVDIGIDRSLIQGLSVVGLSMDHASMTWTASGEDMAM